VADYYLDEPEDRDYAVRCERCRRNPVSDPVTDVYCRECREQNAKDSDAAWERFKATARQLAEHQAESRINAAQARGQQRAALRRKGAA
jgi:hypothetical protein